MTAGHTGTSTRLTRLADAVLLPCFDGTAAPEWVRRRVADGLGGVCLFARNVASAGQVADLSASLAAERPDVVIAIDEEAGDVTRLDAATGSRFPGAFALGRADDPELTRAIAHQVGALLRAAGVSLNLAPCADVTTDPDNPVIGSRSFGTDTALVVRHTAAWVRGHQAAGVATCAKHFPGHGDTNSDSHRSVSVLSRDLDSIRAQELPPFRAAIAAGTAAIMPGHLLVPAVDDVPATVSERWLTTILRGELGFTGTIVTDALEMAAVASVYGIPGAAAASLMAGADLLCIGGQTRPEDEIDAIRDAIVAAVTEGRLSEERLADAAARARSVGLAATGAALAADPEASTGGVSTGGVSTGRVPGGEVPGGEVPAGNDLAHRAALKATERTGTTAPLTDPVVVVKCSDTPNIAVGIIPWGPATVLPGAVEIVLRPGDPLPLDRIAGAGSVLVVTRDRLRHRWMSDVVDRVRATRRDAVLVEMGISGIGEADAPAIASFGATLANTRAVVELLENTAITA